MRVLVTRPLAQALPWVQQLAARGIASAALPLIGIEPAADGAAVQTVWQQLGRHRCVVFVSPNAAQQFFAARPANQSVWPDGVLAASPGPGTSEALLRAGVPPALLVEPPADAAQLDSEALWRVMQQRSPGDGWRGASVLVVRGDGGRDWLADTLRASGAEVAFVAAYRRCAPLWTTEAEALLQTALQTPSAHLWFFSSSEAVAHLGAHVAAPAWRDSQALATHPRIAQAAQGLGFRAVHASRPTLDAVVACIQSIAS